VKTLGVFGGTFDPVHLGHMKMIVEAQRILALDELRVIPCHSPPHREQPRLNSQQRLELMQVAVNHLDGVVVDDRELRRRGPSYTVDTLRELRAEEGDEISVILFIGSDAYANLMHWHQWRELPVLANIGIFSRPQYPLPESGILAEWLKNSRVEQLKEQPAGAVVALRQMQMELSSTEIRRQLASGHLTEDLTPAVRELIKQRHYYNYREPTAT
jgi:nicotinate-nucleotide adenylyltransferase